MGEWSGKLVWTERQDLKVLMPTEIELLTQLAQETTRKLDQLIHDLPERYVDERQHAEIARRVDVLETHVQKIDDTISGLHNSSMAWVNDAIRAVVREITDEGKAMRQEVSDLSLSTNKAISDMQTAFYRTIVMSVALPIVVATIIEVITHFMWK